MDGFGKLILLTNVASTLVMLGVILVVQVVHYPLFGRVGAEQFAAYEAAHTRLITWVVFPPMALELVTAAALVWLRPAALPSWSLWLGLALVGLIWLSTGLVQVPLHSTLRGGFDGDAHRRLVLTNWARTLAWAGRSALVLWWTVRVMSVE